MSKIIPIRQPDQAQPPVVPAPRKPVTSRRGLAILAGRVLAIAAIAALLVLPPRVAAADDDWRRMMDHAAGATSAARQERELRELDELKHAAELEAFQAEEARKNAARAAERYRDPAVRDLCPAPYRMTERDGCQPVGRSR